MQPLKDDSAAPVGIRRQVAGEVLALMGRNRVSQKRLAAELGISQQSLSRRITGEVPFDVDDLEIIARFFARPVAELLSTSGYRSAGSSRNKSDLTVVEGNGRRRPPRRIPAHAVALTPPCWSR